MANIHYIENDNLKIGVSEHGAELVSLYGKDHNREYMWNGDPAYWKRVSPVLFPFVGKLNDQTYRYEGREYTGIPQHGYARDKDFTLVSEGGNAIWMKLEPDDEIKANYPFDFELKIGYELVGSSVHVLWNVKNTGDKDLFFSIGAHPAFMCPGMDKGESYSLDFHKDIDEITSGMLGSRGGVSGETKKIPMKDGVLPMDQELFKDDALILDSDSIHAVSIRDPQGHEFLKVRFDTPLMGIWSPVGKNAPFVCIEPWYGRSDREDYTGDLQHREYGNSLKPGAVFDKGYIIEIL